MRWLRARLPWIAGLLYLAAVLLWLGRDRRLSKEAFEAFSVYNTARNGLSLAYKYLKARGAKVGVLTQPVGRMPLEADAVLFRVRPSPDFFGLGVFRVRLRPDDEESEKDEGEEEGENEGQGEDKEEVVFGAEEEEQEEEQEEPRKQLEEQGEKKEEEQEEPRKQLEEQGEKKEEEEVRFGIPPWPIPGYGDELLTPAEEDWVNGGGRLVLAVDASYGPLRIKHLRKAAPVRKVYPLWAGLDEFKTARLRVFEAESVTDMHAVLAAGEEMLVGRMLLGAGEVFILSCPHVFMNKNIGEKGPLALLEILALKPHATGSALKRHATGLAGRPVYFDEFIHGLQSDVGLLDLIRRWYLGPALLLVLMAAFLHYWRRRVVIGPREEEYEETRTEAVDFVDSLARLYNRALRRRDAVGLYYDALVQETSVRTGLREGPLEAKVRELTGGISKPRYRGRQDIGRQHFNSYLKTINQAFRRLDDAKY